MVGASRFRRRLFNGNWRCILDCLILLNPETSRFRRLLYGKSCPWLHSLVACENETDERISARRVISKSSLVTDSLVLPRRPHHVDSGRGGGTTLFQRLLALSRAKEQTSEASAPGVRISRGTPPACRRQVWQSQKLDPNVHEPIPYRPSAALGGS